MIALNLDKERRDVVVENARRVHIRTTMRGDAQLIGWIEGDEGDALRLFSLGVRGAMRFNGSAFEHCVVTKDVLCRLRREWPRFWGGAFAAVDEDGHVLPYDKQPFFDMQCTGISHG